MIHIVFSEADGPVLQKAIELDPDKTLDGVIIQIKDDYAVGPLADIYTEAGMEARKQWWREVLTGGDYDGLADGGKVNDAQTVSELIEKLENDPEEMIWIWAAQNGHDVCGYYWLMGQLKDYQGRIFILYLNNLPFFNEKGAIFYPERLESIPPKEFLKAKKLARPITPSEFEVDPDEWNKLCSQNKGVRILEGGKKLASFDDDFYDEDLKKMIGAEWQKGSRIIAQYLHKAKHKTGDAYLLWRLKQLAAGGEFEVQGELKNMKDFELKKTASAG
ncbi:MAG TPA: DUF1835 domain-containing protein [Flavitalea sp.]|nr:DUF1835 domain-containing protein [Flavitalea sp.]